MLSLLLMTLNAAIAAVLGARRHSSSTVRHVPQQQRQRHCKVGTFPGNLPDGVRSENSGCQNLQDTKTCGISVNIQVTVKILHLTTCIWLQDENGSNIYHIQLAYHRAECHWRMERTTTYSQSSSCFRRSRVPPKCLLLIPNTVQAMQTFKEKQKKLIFGPDALIASVQITWCAL